jgi:hypothetical protein
MPPRALQTASLTKEAQLDQEAWPNIPIHIRLHFADTNRNMMRVS